MNQDVLLKKLCQEFGGTATVSEQRFVRIHPPGSWDFMSTIADYKSTIIEGVAIHIPKDRLDDFLSVFDEQKYLEMQIRENIPAVKIAYERYRMLLKMCGSDYA
jgi:hypothetical protein